MSPRLPSAPLRTSSVRCRFARSRTRSILAEQIESQFAELNSRKKSKGGITEQVIAELLARTSAKLAITRVVQPSTDRLQAILVRLLIDNAYLPSSYCSQLEGDEMKVYLMMRELSSIEFREDAPKAYGLASVLVLGKTERVLFGEPSGLRVFQSLTDVAMQATQYFSAESFGDAALGRLVRWCEFYASGSSLFQTQCAHCDKILVDDSRYGPLPPTVRTFESGSPMHAICLQRLAASSSLAPAVLYYQ